MRLNTATFNYCYWGKLIVILRRLVKYREIEAGINSMIILSLKRLIAILIFVGAIVDPVLANQPEAQIEAVTGKVMVNSGHGFVFGVADADLRAGDRVLISQNSSLTINYLVAKCSVTYSEPLVFVLPAKAPCKAGDQLASVGTGFVAPANFGTGAPVFTTFAGTSVSTTIGLGFGITVFVAAAGSQYFSSPSPSLSAP